METKQFLNSVKNVVRAFDNDAEVLLFGSRARGDNKSNSDWDLLILLNKSIDEPLKDQIRNKFFDMELETDQVISSIIHNKEKWEELSITPLYQNIKNEGILL